MWNYNYNVLFIVIIDITVQFCIIIYFQMPIANTYAQVLLNMSCRVPTLFWVLVPRAPREPLD